MSATPRTMETIERGQATRHAPSEMLLLATSAPEPTSTPMRTEGRTGYMLVARPGAYWTSTIILSAGQRDMVLKDIVVNQTIDGATVLQDNPAPARGSGHGATR